jgi:hypothetical protein
MMAISVKPVWAFTENGRRSILVWFESLMSTMTATLGFSDASHVEEQRQHHQHQKRQGERRTQGPVPALAELQPDQVAQHHVLAAA